MKKAILSTAVVAAIFAGSALADEHLAAFNINAEVALTTDYRFRGISQTDEEAAVQGGFTVDHKTGVYGGVWASSMQSGSEVDYFAGYNFDLASLNIGAEYRYYDYTGDYAVDPDYDEWSLTASAMGASVGVIYSEDYSGSGSEYIRYGVAYTVPVGPVSFHAHAGLNDFDQPYFADGEDQYVDYEIAAMVDVADNVTVKAAWVGTDLEKASVGGLDLAEDAFILSVSAAL
jgi:uncharacterized protein (TIGR02001 family)